jgi:tetratricopeptide (TPR) repeat protein
MQEMFDRWLLQLSTVMNELRDSNPRLRSDLMTRGSREVYGDVEGKLRGVERQALLVQSEARAVRESVETLRSEWLAARRWTDDGLDDLFAELAPLFNTNPVTAGRRWMTELLDGLDAQEWNAVAKIASEPFPWPAKFRAGVAAIRSGLADWDELGGEAGLAMLERLAREGGLERWDRILRPRLRARAHRLAAWVALRRVNGPTTALKHINEAVDIYPFGGRMLAERAAYFLFVADFDRAATDAQQAIESAGEEPNGYLELGIWAELTGEFDAADELYRRGLERKPTFEIAQLASRSSMIDPPGRLLGVGADVLWSRGHANTALRLADEALLANVRGAEPHPQAFVHRLRSHILASLHPDSPGRAAMPALRAGKLYMWNSAPKDALVDLTRAIKLNPALEEAGWLRADALLAQSLPLGATVPDFDILEEARAAWMWQYDKRPPHANTSWAYLTRAVIADLATQQPNGRRHLGIWTAIRFVEQALVYDGSDAQRWGYAGQYLRYAGLEELALETIEEGSRLSPDDRRILVERLLLLVLHGPAEKAERVADQLVTVYGHDPTVQAVKALMALREGKWPHAIRLLDLPLADGNDPLWYLDMRALCHAADGRTDAALGDHSLMLSRQAEGDAPAIDGIDKCRLATAAVMTGEMVDAERWLDRARLDPTTPERRLCVASAWVQLATGDVQAARTSNEQATADTRSDVQLGDLERELRVRLGLLGHAGEAVETQLMAALETTSTEQAARAGATEPAADDELKRALADVGSWRDQEAKVLARTALLAIAARRNLRDGRLGAAIELYEELRGSFDPAAEVGLAHALESQSAELAREGDVEAVRTVQERLVGLGAISPVASVLAITDAYADVGRVDEARAYLAERLADAHKPADVALVHRRMGMLELGSGHPDSAKEHLGKALKAIRSWSNTRLTGELEVALSVAALLEDDETEAERRLDAALEAWRGPGAGEAELLVVTEFKRLAEQARPEASAATASIVARWAEREGLELIDPVSGEQRDADAGTLPPRDEEAGGGS